MSIAIGPGSFFDGGFGGLARFWTSEAGRLRLLGWLPVVLLLVSGWAAAQLTWQVTMYLAPTQAMTEDLFEPPAYKEQSLPDSFWKWSGWTDLYAKPPPTPQKKIDLKVVVNGILGYGDAGSAMLKVGKKRSASLYFVGDNLGSGVILEEVAINAVKLRKGSLTKTVKLETKGSDLFLEVAPVLEPAETSVPVPDTVRRETQNDVVIFPEKLRPEVRQQLESIGEQAQKDPTSLAKDFSLDAVNRDGSVIGYRLRYNLDPALLLSLGLRPTDIVLEVNGIPVERITGNPGTMASLMGLKEYDVRIERNGRPQNLVIRP